MFFKVQDIINIRTAELIDRLVIITNDTQVLILLARILISSNCAVFVS